jgi:peptidoglycan/xylan/chitin deacetylase (PgdA/CDA1 family)
MESRNPFSILSNVHSLLQKTIGLTIDDGPENSATDQNILRILEKPIAKSIWFMVYANFDIPQNPTKANNRDALVRVAAQGHVIASHIYRHC